ncbi:mCG10509, isoform CRA_a [Mus musculus]|nr:mCG10509, isoform CRA_a [Mus musculus]
MLKEKKQSSHLSGFQSCQVTSWSPMSSQCMRDDPTQDTKRHIIHQNPATLCLYNHRYRGVLPLRFPYFREHRISQMLFVQDSSGTTWSKPVVQFTITDNRGRFTLRKAEPVPVPQ